jgi:hypothetical protein
MNTSLSGKRGLPVAKLGIVVAVVAAVIFSAAYLASPAPAASSSERLTPATGSTEQWAFGGVASSTFSCSNANCFPSNVTFNGTFSLSWKYYIEWVVIYTQTNVSSSQIMVEGQAALNASVSYALSECIPNGTSGGACQSESASISLSGRETALGFTNITSGTVNLTSSVSSPLGSTPALAIQNAASDESFNFSGSYSLTAPTGTGGPVRSANVNFDIGATETSSVVFTTPLGIVPINPQPGDGWDASAPFMANGAWTSGYSLSASGYAGASSTSNWTKGTVSPSGTLGVNGTDLGQFTLYDNYTNPPTTVTAQEILLDFGNGTFAAADGWVMVPTGLYGGIFSGLGLSVSHGPSGSVAETHPAQSNITSSTTGESAYYQHGVGFIGASATGGASSPIGPSSAASPSVKLNAGPEPVSVAEQQYQAITSNAAATGSFPWSWLILGVIVAVVVILGVVLLMRRSRGRRPTSRTPGAAAPTEAASGGGLPGSGPATLAPTPSGRAPTPAIPAAGAAVTCPTCGQPAPYIAQYGRNYCYNEKKYL